MPRTTLQRRLTLLFGVIITSVVGLIALFLGWKGEELLADQARTAGVAIARGLAAASLNDFLNYNYVGLEQKAEETARDPQVAYVILYDKEGAVAAYTGQGSPLTREIPTPLPHEAATAREPRVTERTMDSPPGPGLEVLHPVLLAETGQRWGTIRLGFRLGALHREILRIRLTILLLGVAGILGGWLASLLFTRRITVPLRELVQATVRVAEGDYQSRPAAATGDEVGELAANFESMVARLREQRDALVANLDQIRRLQEFNDLVLLSITNGLITLGAEGRIVNFNRKAEEILRTTAAEALGRTPAGLWGGENPLARLLEAKAAPGPGVSESELRWPRAPGDDRTLAVTLAPILRAGGPPLGLLCLFQDLTERRALEERIRRADRLAAVGTLASGLAHEIRNPLAAVRAFVQMLPDKYQSESFRARFDRTVPRELDRVNGLLEDLLDLVRKPRMNLARVSVLDCLNPALEALEPEILRSGIRVEVERGEGEPHIEADPSYLQRAFGNILLNAVQAMPEGGTLGVRVSSSTSPQGRRETSVRITDSGFGIPRESLPHLFNPFYTSKEKGTGLGLAVTHKIVEDLQGSISVDSERGEWTTFTLTFPAL